MSGSAWRLGRLTRSRTDGSRYWSYCIVWNDDTGLRRRVSLGTTDKVAANTAGRDFWSRLQLTSVDTVGEIMEAYLDTFPEPFVGWTKPDACDQKLRTRIKDGRRKREGWKQSREFWAGLRMGDIDEETSNEYMEWRQRSVNTMRNELNHIRTALSWGKGKGMVAEPPKIVVPGIPDTRVGHLTKPQFRTFLEGCKMPHVKLFAMLAVSTGARKTALLQLKWDQVDFGRGLATLKPEGFEANGKDRATVPLHDRILHELRAAREGSLSEWVIEYKGEPLADVKRGIEAASRRTGIKCHPHMFRHSAAVWMAEDRVPMEEIAAFLGHRNVQITIKVYARFHPDYLRKAAASLTW